MHGAATSPASATRPHSCNASREGSGRSASVFLSSLSGPAACACLSSPESSRVESSRVESSRVESSRVESSRVESGALGGSGASRALASVCSSPHPHCTVHACAWRLPRHHLSSSSPLHSTSGTIAYTVCSVDLCQWETRVSEGAVVGIDGGGWSEGGCSGGVGWNMAGGWMEGGWSAGGCRAGGC